MPRHLICLPLIILLLAGCSSTGPAATPPPSRQAEPEQRATGYRAEGQASYYGTRHHGMRTANGERFDQHALTAAHRTLPFGTRVKVTHLANGRSVTVRINDRGPVSRQRLIDLSRAAAEQLGMLRQGVATVRVEALAD